MKVFYSISTLALLNSLLAPAAMAQTQPTGVGQIGSANVKMAEIRNVLVNNAYRIDKEMVSKSKSTTDFDVKLKFSPEGGKGDSKIFAKAAIGNMLSHEVNYNSKTESETYQIHKKADTWVIIALDKEGYLKNRAAITESDLMQKSLCARNGMAFLDTLVADYKTLSAEQLETVAKGIQNLNEAKIKSAMLADASGKEDVLGNKIDEFLDQRTRVVRIHWQELLNRSSDCQSDFMMNFTTNADSLYQDLKKSSLFLNGNSLANVPEITFSAMPYKSSASQKNAARISAVGARLLVHKVQALKMMKDLGYVEFQRGRDMDFSQSEGEISRVILKKVPGLLQFGNAQYEREKNIDSATNGLLVTAAVIASGVNSLNFNDNLSRSTQIGIRSGLAAAVGSGATAIYLSFLNPHLNKKGLAKQDELVKEIHQDIMKDQKFVTATNDQIALTEAIYSLAENKDYMKRRLEWISTFKGNLANKVMSSMFDNVGKKDFTKVSFSYAEYLVESNLISKQAYFEMAQIVGLMTRSEVIANNVNQILVQKNQIQTLLTAVQAIKAENKDSSKQQDLERLEKNLKNELEILKLLK